MSTHITTGLSAHRGNTKLVKCVKMAYLIQNVFVEHVSGSEWLGVSSLHATRIHQSVVNTISGFSCT